MHAKITMFVSVFSSTQVYKCDEFEEVVFEFLHRTHDGPGDSGQGCMLVHDLRDVLSSERLSRIQYKAIF